MRKLREQLAATQAEGDEAEKAADGIWDQYNREQAEREKTRREAAVRREERMKKLQDAYKHYSFEEAEGQSFEDWRRSRGFEPPPSFEERYRDEMPHYRRLLEKLKSMRGGVRFDADAETRRWEDFQAAADAAREIGLDDIPIPASGMVGMSTAEFKVMAKRYHPDKFMQRYKHKLKEDEAEAVLETVVAVFQKVNAAHRA